MIETVLCMDIGTTSLKAGLITSAGEVVSFCSIPFNESSNEKIASEWLESFYLAKEKLLLQNQVLVKAIAISGNGPTVVSENGITLKWNEPSKKTIETPSIFIPRILLFKEKFNEEYNKSKWIFSGPEYLIWKLTGKAFTIIPEKRYEIAYWTEEDLVRFGIEKEKLPPFVEIGFNFGNTSDGIPVIGVGPDFIAGLIGTGTIDAGKICDRCGSSEGINFCVDKEIRGEGIRTLPSLKSDLWNISVLIPDSGYISEEKRIEKVTAAVNQLKKIAEKNEIKFPEEMTVTGGQAKNDDFLRKKSAALNMRLVVQNCADAELLGDAKIAWEKL